MNLRMNSNIIKERLLHKGAEANLFYGRWFDKRVIFKQRIPKGYRLEELDIKIRTKRTLNEARALIKIKSYGINVPQVFEIDMYNSTIIMKYIEGKKLKYLLEDIDESKKKEILYSIGKSIAIMHKNGHIHGDITTSNIITTNNDENFLIDFGLHEYSDSIEDKSVDLHLFKRVLISTHGESYKLCFKAFLNGYRSEYENSELNEYKEIINNISTIETRGRYVKKGERL